jgi:hypothetical protein
MKLINQILILLILSSANISLSLKNFTKSECQKSDVKSTSRIQNLFDEFRYENLTKDCEKSIKVYEEGINKLEIWALESKSKDKKILKII